MAVVDELKKGDFDGFEAVLSVVPYYNKPSQEGIYQHYKSIAEASPLPVILYNCAWTHRGQHDCRDHPAAPATDKHNRHKKRHPETSCRLREIIKTNRKHFQVIFRRRRNHVSSDDARGGRRDFRHRQRFAQGVRAYGAPVP